MKENPCCATYAITKPHNLQIWRGTKTQNTGKVKAKWQLVSLRRPEWMNEPFWKINTFDRWWWLWWSTHHKIKSSKYNNSWQGGRVRKIFRCASTSCTDHLDNVNSKLNLRPVELSQMIKKLKFFIEKYTPSPDQLNWVNQLIKKLSRGTLRNFDFCESQTQNPC